jgi:hypothetical protein
LSTQNIIDLQTWHLNNVHIQFNGTVWRQIKGIAQGTNQSPDLAELILMNYEYNFNPKIAKQFKYTTQKMDNIIFINNSTVQQHIYKNIKNPHGIYPQ